MTMTPSNCSNAAHLNNVILSDQPIIILCCDDILDRHTEKLATMKMKTVVLERHVKIKWKHRQ